MDDDLIAEVRALNIKVKTLSGDVVALRDVQEQRRVETLEIAEKLRKENVTSNRRRTRVISGFLAAIVAAVVVFGAIISGAIRDGQDVGRANRAAIEAEQLKFCPLAWIVFPRPGDPLPPPGPDGDRGRRVIEIAKGVANDLRCPPFRP